jgi:outer membrane immunogenic protein
MKKLFAGAAIALITAPAMGQDIPVSAYGPPLVVPPLVGFSWTGCHFGGHIGGSWNNQKFSGQFVDSAIPQTLFGTPTIITIPNANPNLPPRVVTTFTGAPVAPATAFAISDNSFDYNSSSFLLGGQLGCDLQFARSWVIGVEGDFSWANPGHSPLTEARNVSFPSTVPLQGIIDSFGSNGVITSRTDFISTLAARLGYTFGPRGQGMIYLKGGAAWARNKYQFTGATSGSICTTVQRVIDPTTTPPTNTTTCLTTFPFGGPFNFGTSEWRVGWTLGMGFEWVMFDNVSIKFEYDYLDLGGQNVTFNDPILPATTLSIGQRINEVKLGLNYRFFGAPPLRTY